MINYFEGTNVRIAEIHISSKESIEAFKELVQRATNLWPDAPPEIKRFADQVTNGAVLQDYDAQALSARPGRRS